MAYSGGTSSSYMPSIMASLVGCSSLTTTAEEWALTSSTHVDRMPTMAPTRSTRSAACSWRFLMRYHAPTAMEMNEPMTSSDSTVWK